MTEEGFYVTLPCNASLSVYPENRISNYTTMLARVINLKGRWEVGLVEFEYPISWYTFNEEDSAFVVNTGETTGTDSENNAVDYKSGGKEPEFFFNSGQKVRKLLNRLKTGYYDDVVFLIREINTHLPPRASFGYDHVKNKVYLKAPPKTSLLFYGKLANILGLKPGVPIETGEQSPEDHSTGITLTTYAPYQADINGGFYTMYIYTDVIEYQTVGDHHVPLLRCVHIDGEHNKIVSVRYDRPHYVSVNKSSINEISIQVKDDRNQDVRFSYGKVCAKLHFRPVKQCYF